MSFLLKRMCKAYQQNRKYHLALSELNAMSDAEIRDLDLSRSDFRRMAADEALRR